MFIAAWCPKCNWHGFAQVGRRLGLSMDGRAKTSLGDYPAERPTVLEVCASLEEARESKKKWGDACTVDGITGKILWEEE